MFPKNFENIVKSNLSKNLPKILPKSFQNPFKILPKPTKIAPKSFQNRYWIPNAFQNRPERDFFDFLLIFGASGASQNQAKITKNRKKTMKNRCQKNTWFSIQFFLDFARFWPPKTIPKSRFFRYCFAKCDVLKINKKHWKTNGF